MWSTERRRKYKTCLLRFHFHTFLQFASLHFSFSSGYPSMSVSFPQRYPFPAQPIPHWEDKLKPLGMRLVWSCKLKRKKKLSIFLPDRWWNRPSLGYTERWRHRGWSGCCRSWSPACSPSPDLQWNRTYSCRSGRSPVREQIHLFFLHSNCKSTKMARGTRVQCLNAWPRSCGTASWRCSLRCRVLGIRRCRRRPRLNKVIILRYVIFLSRGAV